MLDKYAKHAWEVIRNVPRHGEEEFKDDPTRLGTRRPSRGGVFDYSSKLTLNDNIRLAPKMGIL